MTNNDDKFKVVSLEDRIRAKLGVDENYLSDEDINYPDVFSVAELNIGRLFPSYKDFEGDNLVYFESILVLESCILVCPSMPARLPKKELGPHASHELWINWEKRRMSLSTKGMFWLAGWKVY